MRGRAALRSNASELAPTLRGAGSGPAARTTDGRRATPQCHLPGDGGEPQPVDREVPSAPGRSADLDRAYPQASKIRIWGLGRLRSVRAPSGSASDKNPRLSWPWRAESRSATVFGGHLDWRWQSADPPDGCMLQHECSSVRASLVLEKSDGGQ